MKTVKEFINELEEWINSGHLTEDSPVVLSYDILACQEEPMFECGIIAGPQPNYDSNEPTKQACYLHPIDRIETDYDKVEKELRYKYRKRRS